MLKKRMAVISAGFVPVPAVDGGAGEVLTTEIINGNEISGDYYMDIYTIASPKLDTIKYKNADIMQIHITKWNWFICKARNFFLKLFKRKYRFIPYNRKLLKMYRDNYDVILIENNMQVYEDIYNHAKHGTDNMIYHMHNDIDGTTKPEYLCRFISKTAKNILPVSEYIKRHFNEVAPNNKMNVLYNCIDFNVFDVNKTYNTVQLKKKYGIEDDDFVFLYSGRVCPEKGVLELVKAFKAVYKQYNNGKLLIVGSTWYNLIGKDEYYEALVKEAEDCKENIIFTGYMYPQKMPDIYTLADVLVIPTICEEAFGMVALEGMAMKVPIISTNAGGMIEVADRECAMVVDRGENLVIELESAIRELISNEEKRRQLASKAYTKVTEDKRFHKEFYYRNFLKCIGEEE